MVDRDYDAARGGVLELTEELPHELQVRRSFLQSGMIDEESEGADAAELPGADLSHWPSVEVIGRVQARQPDELTCSACFLVLHRSRFGSSRTGRIRCRDCA